MAQGDDKFVVRQRPIQQALHIAAFGQLVKRAVAAGNQHGDVGGIGRGYFVQNVGKVRGFVELGQVFGVDFGDGFVFAQHRPHFKFGVVARQGGDVDFKAGFVDVQHRQQGFYGVVAGGEELAVLHLQIALVGGDHQHFEFAAGVGLGKFCAGVVGVGRGVLAQRVVRGEKALCSARSATGCLDNSVMGKTPDGVLKVCRQRVCAAPPPAGCGAGRPFLKKASVFFTKVFRLPERGKATLWLF